MRPLSPSQRETLEEATTQYQASLTDEAAGYLESRGLGLSVQLSARLGVVDDAPFPGHHRVKGWLSIPYLDHQGLPLALRFRCLSSHDHADPYGKGDGTGRHGKYMSSFGDTPRIYNVGAIHRAAVTGDPIEIAEGEMDALLLESLGFHAVAIPGVQTWQKHTYVAFKGFNVIRVWADGDDAGAVLAERITRSLYNARAVKLTEGDVGETYLKGGAEALFELAGGKPM